MIKIYEMSIRGVKPFEAKEGEFKFGPFLNLIRGHNGAGKTTVQEALALLGHCSILGLEPKNFHKDKGCQITYTLFLDNSSGIRDFLKNDGLEELLRCWEMVFPANASTKEYKEIKVKIYPRDEKLKDDLKSWLTEEKRLTDDWCITGENDDEIKLLQEIIKFSRPSQIKSEEQRFEKIVLSRIKKIISDTKSNKSLNQGNIAKFIVTVKDSVRPKYKKPQRTNFLGKQEFPILPPYICYFNSDMYKWGIGLDIRETPKHLKRELAGLLKYRFFLVTRPGEVTNCELVKEFWKQVFAGEREKVGVLKKLVFEGNDAKPTVGEVGSEDSDREFMSSGENQTLALGIILRALQPKGSIIILDEPDLHLSLPSAVRMYNSIYANCLEENTQIIAVSHLPFVFSNSLHSDNLLESKEGFHNLWRNSKDEKFEKKVLTLFFLEKNGKEVDCFLQGKAAEKAGEYQNKEIEAIIRQARKEFRWKSVFFKFKASQAQL